MSGHHYATGRLKQELMVFFDNKEIDWNVLSAHYLVILDRLPSNLHLQITILVYSNFEVKNLIL